MPPRSTLRAATPERPLGAARALALLASVAARVGLAHNDVALIQAVYEALAQHLPLRWLELGDVRTDDAAVDTLALGAPGGAPMREQRPLRGALARRAIEGAAPVWIATHAGRDAAPEAVRATRAGAATLVVLALAADAGYAAIGLGAGSPTLDRATLAALAGVLAGAVEHVRLVARVAAVSRRAHAEREQLRDELQRRAAPDDGLVAVSASMRRVLDELVELVAVHDTTVLLRGESGTGKELVARRIHARSPRAARPLLRVNCGALPETLVESALFGHERGAFTGAVARHAGLFERAQGGTLLLDEVAELPLGAQAKLLRVLQEREFERVGGTLTLRADVRVVAATHRPLEDLVARGAFRADLLYRLDVFPIVIPPLRARRDDVPALAAALLARIAARHGRAPPALTPSVLARLGAYAWPGNVRELENVLERALILSRGSALRLPDGFGDGSPAADPPAGTGPVRTFAQASRDAIEHALRASDGRIHGAGGAAARLGLKPTTLQSKMRRLGIQRSLRNR